MTNQHYIEKITKQSQEKFNQMKERMLEPVKQVQEAGKENLRNLLTEIEKKQGILHEKKYVPLWNKVYNDETTTKQE